MLFHLRGVRRVWIYPKTEDFLPQEAAERIIIGESGNELPGVRAKDQEAWRFDIVPGEALAWPLHAPHRIENDEGVCVSVVVKFETADSAITNGALLANSVLRRWNWEVPDVDKTSPASAPASGLPRSYSPASASSSTSPQRQSRSGRRPSVFRSNRNGGSNAAASGAESNLRRSSPSGASPSRTARASGCPRRVH